MQRSILTIAHSIAVKRGFSNHAHFQRMSKLSSVSLVKNCCIFSYYREEGGFLFLQNICVLILVIWMISVDVMSTLGTSLVAFTRSVTAAIIPIL